MTSIDSKGISVGNARPMTREEFFAGEAKKDLLYDQHRADMKNMETMSKSQVKASADPWAVMHRMKISDGERAILAEVAQLNGWSRQATEGFYQLYVATGGAEINGIGDFLKALTNVQPGYYGEGGGHTLGLLESDRRRLMGLPPIDPNAPEPDFPEDEVTAPKKKSDTTDAGAVWVASSLSRQLTEEEKLAVAQAAKLNGWDEQSAAAAFKMYIAKNSEGSLQAFLQLLSQLEPDAYGSKGDLDTRHGDDDKHWFVDVEV